MKRSVEIDMDLLVKEMYKKGVTPKILRKQLSVSDSWWSVFNCTERTSGRTEALICKVLGKEPGFCLITESQKKHRNSLWLITGMIIWI